jgi:hypothetical protein
LSINEDNDLIDEDNDLIDEDNDLIDDKNLLMNEVRVLNFGNFYSSGGFHDLLTSANEVKARTTARPRDRGLRHRFANAVLIERRGQLGGDVVGGPAFDLPALDHFHQLAVAEQRHRGG